MRPSEDLGVIDLTASPIGRSLAPPSPGAARPSAAELAREINRRLAIAGSGVRAELDRPPRERTHLVLRGPTAAGPGSAPAWEELVRVESLPPERDRAVDEVLAAVESKSWERSPGATVRLARSSVWCDPR
ncbi:MAG TPA: hypothetical protein VIZ68_04550 [Thermoplasmata archaeon]